jgi:hypothetical protein
MVSCIVASFPKPVSQETVQRTMVVLVRRFLSAVEPHAVTLTSMFEKYYSDI